MLMLKLTLIPLLLVLTIPVNPAIRPYEVKPERQACSQQTYNVMCIPRIRTVEVDKVNWI